ncbi:hypothetical protein EG888_06030, partial [Listeria monocytogenes]|nr:hypothetical protein [Listeria monocytogenes]
VEAKKNTKNVVLKYMKDVLVFTMKFTIKKTTGILFHLNIQLNGKLKYLEVLKKKFRHLKIVKYLNY